MNNQNKKNGKKQKEVNYTAQDLHVIENPHTYSTFGKMVESTKKNAPKYGFEKSTRNNKEKVFVTKQLSKIHFLGKTGPGPIYNPDFISTLNRDPAFSFGTGIRDTTALKEPFDHFSIVDKYSDVNKADLSRRPNPKSFKFRAGNRVG